MGHRLAGAVPPLDAVIFAAGFGFFVGRLDLGIAKSPRQHAVVVSMGQFVQRKGRHPEGLRRKDAEIRKLHALGHRRVASVFAQPVGVGMVLGARSHTGVFR